MDLESCETLYRDGKRIADVNVYYDGKWWVKDLDTNVMTRHDSWDECVKVMRTEFRADKIIRRGQHYF